MHRPKILVVGSMTVDITLITDMFPESGQTVLGESYSTAPGGKGANQAMEAALLGAEVTMVGKAGVDAYGDAVLASLRGAGVDVSHFGRTTDGTPSAIGNIIITRENGKVANNRIVVIPGSNMCITREDIAFLENTIGTYDMVILQFEIPMEINQAVAEMAHKAGVPVMLNPAPIADIPDDLMRNITYLSPNETEAARLLGCHIREEGEAVTEEAIAGIKAAMEQKGLHKLLLTLGDAGSMIIDNDTVSVSPCAKGIHVVDPTAAGDSFVGAFCVAKCVGLSDNEAMDFSNLIAARTVSVMGAQTSLSTLDEAIRFHREANRDTAIIERVKKEIA